MFNDAAFIFIYEWEADGRTGLDWFMLPCGFALTNISMQPAKQRIYLENFSIKAVQGLVQSRCLIMRAAPTVRWSRTRNCLCQGLGVELLRPMRQAKTCDFFIKKSLLCLFYKKKQKKAKLVQSLDCLNWNRKRRKRDNVDYHCCCCCTSMASSASLARKAVTKTDAYKCNAVAVWC